MRKKIIALSAVAALSVNAFATDNSDITLQLELLKKQIASLEKKMNKNTKKIKKVAKKVKRTGKKLNKVKAHDAGDNIKWDVDFRTTVDNIDYKKADGTHSKNHDLLSSRLLLNMKFKADEKVTFYGTLAYNKTFGSSTDTNPNYANFDWITNETATTDSTLRVKEAYWLYMNDTFFGTDVSWTASIGRRPSTGGLGISYREGDKPKSAIASTVNVEFDGASFRWNLGNVTPLPGAWFKICMGRGLTNAKPRFAMDGTDYSNNDMLTEDSDMIGLIAVPYDDGQYSLWTNYAQASHLIGYDMNDMMAFQMAAGAYQTNPNGTNLAEYMNAANSMKFQDVGDISYTTVMFKADGIGSEINDFLDNTTFFTSYSTSKTDPTSGKRMLGSPDSKTGNSIWVGVQMPCPLTEDGRLGLEWNKGSKYWRSMTYAEDTAIGSKIAARGTATEVYWIKPLTPSLTFNARYTYIDYDYTGSNGFFGDEGTPMTMDQAKAAGQNPVDTASDIRASIRYRF